MHKWQSNPYICKSLSFGGLAFNIGIVGLNTFAVAAWAQLPPTNMGNFVHQPGDNQYTSQTQAERHGSQTPMRLVNGVPTPVSAAPSSNTPAYRTTPAAPKPDISLLPIVADEPLKPAGFPPLPDRLDLPVSSSTTWIANAAGQTGAVANNGAYYSDGGISRGPTGVHEHYVHYQPGAFIPPSEAQQKPIYRPTSVDYYNVNPAAKVGSSGSGAGDFSTPATDALKKMAPEPRLAADIPGKPEVPSAVTVNQSVTQDLSLPEDDFNKHYPTSINNPNNSVSHQVGQMLMYPVRGVFYSGVGMGMGLGMGALSTAVHR